jgi:phosphate transport system substrate-binding protein
LKHYPDTAPNSGSGLEMLLQGKVDFALSSCDLEEENIKYANQLEVIAIARIFDVVIVGSQVNISGLTVNQLKDIDNGEICNWREVGD